MQLNVAKIESVYSGKDGKCCCGCSGKHYYPTEQKALAEKRGGKVSDPMVKKVVHMINDVLAMPESLQKLWQLDVNASYVSIVKEGRLYIAYHAEESSL